MVESHLIAALLIQSPCYYGHFILVLRKVQSVIFLFKGPLKYGQLVNMTRLTGFLCTLFHSVQGLMPSTFRKRQLVKVLKDVLKPIKIFC